MSGLSLGQNKKIDSLLQVLKTAKEDTSLENAGNGLKSMKRRATEMKAEFVIESQIGGGTQVELILKA